VKTKCSLTKKCEESCDGNKATLTIVESATGAYL